jgi:hypothetical protein
VQMFQYVDNAAAIAERDRRLADMKKKKDSGAPAKKDAGTEKAQPPSGL